MSLDKILKSALAIVLITGLYACSSDGRVEKLAHGTEILWYSEGKGEVVKEGDFIVLDAIITTSKGEEKLNTYKEGGSIELLIQKKTFEGDMNHVFTYLKEGDSVLVSIPIDSIFKTQGRDDVPDSLKGLIMENRLKVKKHFIKGEQSDTEFQETIQAYMDEKNKEKREMELANFKKYLEDNDLDTKVTTSGLHYIVEKEGTGEKASEGDNISMHYTGKLLSGEVFDTSREEVAKENDLHQPGKDYTNPLSFTIGAQQVIKGWDEAALLFNKGTKATLFIPSNLAYGSRAVGPIPAFSTLIFEIEVMDIKKTATAKK